MGALAGYGGSVLISSTSTTTLTDEVLTDSGDHQTFNISSSSYATKRYWDRATAFTVQTTTDGGSTWTTTTNYTIRYVTGQIVLGSALTGTPGCRIHAGAYRTFATFGQMHQWEATPATDLSDISTFGDKWKDYLPILMGVDVKLDQFYPDATLFDITTGGSSNLFIVSGLTGRNAYERYEGYARFKTDDIKTVVNAPITEALTATIDGQFYYFAGQYS